MNNSCKFVKLVDKILLSVLTQDSALRAQRFVFRPQPIVQALFIILFLLADKAEAALPTWIDTLQVSTGITTSLHTPPPFWSTANQDGRNSALSTQHSAALSSTQHLYLPLFNNSCRPENLIKSKNPDAHFSVFINQHIRP